LTAKQNKTTSQLQYTIEYVYYFALSTLLWIFGFNLVLRKGHAATKFLGFYFITFGVRLFLSFYATDGRILEYPHLFRVLSPFHFLFGPLAFLFLRYILTPNKKFTRWHCLHFLPFVLHAAELMPFYFGPVENKLEEIQQVFQAQSLVNYVSHAGIVPIKIISLLKLASVGGYAIAGIILLAKFISQNSKAFYQKNKLILNWLIADATIRFVSLICVIAYATGKISFNNLNFSYADLLMHLDATFNVIVVFLYPYLLDGPQFTSLVHRLNEGERIPEAGENPQKLQKYRQISANLEQLLEDDAIFLNPQLVQEHVANRLQIPVRELSRAISYVYGLSFPDFINTWRIQYLVEKRKSNEVWRAYSLEVLAESGGFGSRQGLSNATNRLYQTSPGKYFSSNGEE
jgi:AraC-like DNA-binding protein